MELVGAGREHPPLRQGLVDFGPLLGTGQPLHARLAQSRIAVHSGNPNITLVKHIDSVIIDDLKRQRRDLIAGQTQWQNKTRLRRGSTSLGSRASSAAT